MHEYSLMENVIENIVDELKKDPVPEGETIKTVVIKVGALDIHSEESFAQAFAMIAKETPLAGCSLEIQIEPGSIECAKCGYSGPCPVDEGDGHDPMPVAACPKCSAVTRITGGRGIQTINIVTDSSS